MEYNHASIDNSLVYPVNEEFVKQANLINIQYQQLKQQANQDYYNFWGELAKQNLLWQQEFTQICDEKHAPFYRWFVDGKINISYNCLDRHLASSANKIAIYFESDDEQTINVTYQELYHLVCKLANGLKSLKIQKNDRVIIYMPHSIDAIVAMQACARIGAIHCVIFAGFSAKALMERIVDAQATCIITVDWAIRGGKVNSLKQNIDDAIAMIDQSCLTVKHVLVGQTIYSKSLNTPKQLTHSYDIWLDDLLSNQHNECEPCWVDSEQTLFILYTSGSTGKPKGIEHRSAGYLLGVILTTKWILDGKCDDIFWCSADIGWITGHSYVCYGPLATGMTQVIFEGTPVYPHVGRIWQIIEKYHITIFYTAPTLIRTLIKFGDAIPQQFNLSSLRLLGSVGEPINAQAWLWYYHQIGNNKCPIVDTWWQTETGCHMLAPIPAITPLKPGSCTHAIPGIMAKVINAAGDEIINNTGYLVIVKPFPSQIKNIWNDSAKYIATYYPNNIAHGKYYVSGDYAYIDQDNYFWIMGRIDDVLNVSGHRIGTMEIESALTLHKLVAEVAVIGTPNAIKGESIHAFVVCKSDIKADIVNEQQLSDELRIWVTKAIGAIARPDVIYFIDQLPKTRSGKIMRRLLRSLANHENITQDISTLEQPSIINDLKININKALNV